MPSRTCSVAREMRERFGYGRNTNAVKEDARAGEQSPPHAATLDEIYRTHARRVARYAARLAGPQLDQEDIVHDVFLVVERRLSEFRGEAQMSTWLFQITTHVVRGYRRKFRQRSLLPFRLMEQAPTPVMKPNPAEALESRQDAELCYRILDKLPEKQRVALILFELEGQSGDEIAAIMGAPTDTVWVWLHRARRSFLKHLQRLEARGNV